jgi:uncharacterized protein YgbK (DUF1537 family)
MRVGIIADDLTSAMDGGVQFARAGFKSVVTLDSGKIRDFAQWPVVAVDADSRVRTPAAAAASVARCVAALRDRDLLYKTIDSTIRGHVAVELRAAQEASGRRAAILAPAFPAAGRRTRMGRQYLDDIPLSRTAFAQDPYHPVADDDIRSILARAGIDGVRLLDRTALRDPLAVNAALAASACVVADAETDDDLEALVRAVTQPREVLWVGSPGLARALARSLAPPEAREEAPTQHVHRLVVAVGSLNPSSRRQLVVLRKGIHCSVVEVDPTLALKDAMHAGQTALDAAALGPTAASAGATVVVTSSTPSGAPHASGPDTARVADAIAYAVALLQKTRPFKGFILTGGDTAAHVARRVGATAIEVEREFAPGIAIGSFTGATSARVLTKAGGFGDDATLMSACQYLRGERSARDAF